MAIINCNECQKEVSDQAKICPNCGYDLQKEKNTKIAAKGCLWIFGIIFVVILFSMLIPDSASNSKNLEAYVYSQQLIELQLKTPGTANFPTFEDSFVNQVGNIYTINAFVDSENSFGANVRSRYKCILRYENDVFFVESISIN